MTSEQHLKCEIGTIPPDWNVNKLSDLVDKIKSGGTPTSTKKEYYGGDIPFVKIEDITASNRYLQATKISISDEGLNSSNAWLVPEGSLLYSIYATVGEVIINQVPVATNQAIMGIIPNKKVETDYLYYFLQGIKNKLSIYFKETTQKNLTAEIVKNFRIGLPPLPEQHKITSILSKVDEHISHTEAIIEKTEELKRGLMQQLLTKGIGHTKFKKVRIVSKTLEIPETWNVVELKDITTFMKNGFVGTASPYYTEGNGGIPYLMSNNVRQNKIDEKTIVKVTPEFHVSNPLSEIKCGDMLTVQSGHIGTSCVVPKKYDGCNCHALIISRFKPDDALSEYVSQFLNSNIGYDIMSKIFVGSTLLHINTKDFKRLEIPLPSLIEQQKIASILSKVDTQLSQNQTYLSHLQELKKGLMQDLLTGKVRVGIGTNH